MWLRLSPVWLCILAGALVGTSVSWFELPRSDLVKADGLHERELSKGWLQCQGMSSLLTPWVTCHLLSPVFAANLGLKSKAVAPVEQPAYQGPVHCITTIVRNEGLAGLYRGASAMLLRDVPGYCLYFIPYVFLSEWITPEACTGPSPCAVWLAGGMAGKNSSSWSRTPVQATAVGQLGNCHALLSPGGGQDTFRYSPNNYLLGTYWVPGPLPPQPHPFSYAAMRMAVPI